MQNDKSLNEAMANLAVHDLKSMTVKDSNGVAATDNFMDRFKTVQTERAIVKSNEFIKQNQLVKLSSSNQWPNPISPDPLINKPSFNYKTDSFNGASKETLWASTQSSPNSTTSQHDQIRNQFKKSTSTPSNLWESPNLKLSHQSALMIKNDSSNSSVWYTPPQIQSPAISSGQSIWDSPSSSILNHSIESFSSSDCASSSLLRPQDLSPNDGWYNSANKLQSTAAATAFNTFKADTSVWSNASPVGSKIESNIYTSTPYKTSSSSSTAIEKDTNKKSIANTDANPASSSCLQLFSDDFINYLNMIN